MCGFCVNICLENKYVLPTGPRVHVIIYQISRTLFTVFREYITSETDPSISIWNFKIQLRLLRRIAYRRISNTEKYRVR